jgi:hypothetical protein
VARVSFFIAIKRQARQDTISQQDRRKRAGDSVQYKRTRYRVFYTVGLCSQSQPARFADGGSQTVRVNMSHKLTSRQERPAGVQACRQPGFRTLHLKPQSSAEERAEGPEGPTTLGLPSWFATGLLQLKPCWQISAAEWPPPQSYSCTGCRPTTLESCALPLWEGGEVGRGAGGRAGRGVPSMYVWDGWQVALSVPACQARASRASQHERGI